MNVFNWSIPFVSEKVLEVYTEIYKHLQNTEDVEIESNKFIKALEEVANDEDIGQKISFLNKRKELQKKIRE